MSDFGGFSFLSPQEVQAQMDQRRQQGLMGSTDVARRTNIESALDGLFGNPQMRQAQRIQTRVQTASQGVKQKEGEDSLDFELRRLQGIRDAVADVDPSVASQINERILQLGESKFQRSRLTAQDKRAQESHDLDMGEKRDEATTRKLTGGSTYVLNKRDGSMQAFDLLDPSKSSDFQKAAACPTCIVITPAQAFSLYHDETVEGMKLRKQMAAADGLSKVELQRAEQVSAGLLDLHATADRIFQVLETNPDVFTAASAGAMKLDKLATELGAAGRAASGGKTVEGQSIDDWLKSNSITNTRAQGLIVGLAYSTAKANDPSGRISDKDLAAAVEMVGGNNPNPGAIIANLNDNLTRSTRAITDRLDTMSPEVRERMTPRLNLLNKRMDEFQQRFAKYAQGNSGPGAAGATAPPSKDGWTTVNGVRIRIKPGQ
jgi:hypothetical protein